MQRNRSFLNSHKYRQVVVEKEKFLGNFVARVSSKRVTRRAIVPRSRTLFNVIITRPSSTRMLQPAILHPKERVERVERVELVRKPIHRNVSSAIFDKRETIAVRFSYARIKLVISLLF